MDPRETEAIGRVTQVLADAKRADAPDDFKAQIFNRLFDLPTPVGLRLFYGHSRPPKP